MKRVATALVIVSLVGGLTIFGCAKKAANSQEAITTAKEMKTVEAQVNYLVGQANAFVNSKNFDEAINTAKYVLANLDSNSQAAKDIATKATEEMKKAAMGAMDDMKNKLGSFGK